MAADGGRDHDRDPRGAGAGRPTGWVRVRVRVDHRRVGAGQAALAPGGAAGVGGDPAGLLLVFLRARPGELVHLDVKKLGRLRPGGGHRVHGRDSAQHRSRDQQRARRGRVGYDYVHAAVDDYSRLAYAEVLADEQGGTCAGFLRRAGACFAAHGIAIQRVLTDNAFAYRHSRQVQAAVAELGAVQRFCRSYHPETNGKVERFNRNLLAGRRRFRGPALTKGSVAATFASSTALAGEPK